MSNDSKNIPIDVARYFIYKANMDGDVITPLKMQKLIYYAYVWTLVKRNQRLFDESFEAWPNGPVLPSLYREFKRYGGSPIPPEFMNLSGDDDLEQLKKIFPEDVIALLDKVYEKYIVKTAFELVTLTHNESPWKNARAGLPPTEHSENKLSDEDILAQYGKTK